jgi:hypothetical protein
VFRRRFGFSADYRDFPAELFLFRLNFSIFLQRLRRSADNLNFRAKIQISAGDVRARAEDLNLPLAPQIFSDNLIFPWDFSILRLRFRISGGTSNVRLTI